jgi:MoxR-like ATPase
MAHVNNTQLRRIMRAAFFTPGYKGRWGLPLLVEGDPGMGKSAGIEAEAKLAGMWSKVLLGATCDQTDFGGYPAPAADDGRWARMLLPAWLRDVDNRKNKAGVLIMDELTCVPAGVQAAMLRFFLEGWLGDYQVPSRVRMIAACNPVEQAAGGQDLALPMRNRFGHLRASVIEIDDWADVLRGDFDRAEPMDAEAVEAQVMDVWQAEFERAQAVVMAFLRRRPDLRQKTPKVNSPEADGAWASLRTWEFAMRAIASARIHGLTEAERDLLVAAFVGDSTAVEFAAWLRDADLPEPADVLDRKIAWQPVSFRPDRTQAVLDSCTACVLADKDAARRTERARVLWSLLGGMQDSPDLALNPATRLSRVPELGALPEATNARRLLLTVARAVNLGGLKA